MSKADSEAYWDKIIGQANAILTGASDAGLYVQLFDTLEEFFDGSNCWQEAIGFTVIPDTVEYQVQPLSGRILRLYGVLDQNNISQAAVMPTIGTVRFLYPYTNTQPMTATVVKTVTDPFQCHPPHIPDWMLSVHGRTILNGLLGSMMLHPGTSYSNPQMSAFNMQRFRDGIAHARVASMRMNTVGTAAWAFPQQFRVSGQRGGVSTFNVHPSPTPLR